MTRLSSTTAQEVKGIRPFSYWTPRFFISCSALYGTSKDVDLLIVPNADHTLMTHQNHGTRRRWNYFVQHLMGTDPPGVRSTRSQWTWSHSPTPSAGPVGKTSRSQ